GVDAVAESVRLVVLGGGDRVIDEQRRVGRTEFVHANAFLWTGFWRSYEPLAVSSAVLMAAITRRWTASGFPGMRAPAAAGCPPPPNWPATTLTFTRSLLERRLTRVSSGSTSSKTYAPTTGSVALM